MKSWPKLILTITILSPVAYASAQHPPDPVCIRAEKVPIPKADMPPPGIATSLGTCDPLELQSSAGHPIDLRDVRYCVYTAREAKNADGVPDMNNISGDAGLVMIYAGGKGVAPNLPLAIHFACEIQGGWDDGAGVAKMLDEKRKQGAVSVDFDICDSPTGRQLSYLCIVRDQNRVSKEVDRAEKRFDTGSPQQQAAFRQLLTARKDFLLAREAEEPRGSSDMAQEAMRGRIDLDHTWTQLLERLSAGKLPRYSQEDFRKADADLNSAYRVARSETASCVDQFCMSADQLQQLERAWIKYRDAWVAYGTLRWSTVSADSWRTWLTLEQTEDLKGIEN